MTLSPSRSGGGRSALCMPVDPLLISAGWARLPNEPKRFSEGE
jgi:hypothetical protein